MATRKFICSICGYVHEGNEAPDTCPPVRRSQV